MALPVCPCCETVYRFGEVRKSLFSRKMTCYHCKKDFKVSKRRLPLLLLAVIFTTLAVDFFELFFVKKLSAAALLITNIIIVAAGYFLSPFFIKYIKLKDER